MIKFEGVQMMHFPSFTFTNNTTTNDTTYIVNVYERYNSHRLHLRTNMHTTWSFTNDTTHIVYIYERYNSHCLRLRTIQLRTKHCHIVYVYELTCTPHGRSRKQYNYKQYKNTTTTDTTHIVYIYERYNSHCLRLWTIQLASATLPLVMHMACCLPL